MVFSVVIPTLGGDALLRTINLINAGTLVPNEILICIPKDFVEHVAELSSIKNVKILALDVKGQVRQRVEGFKQVTNDYIIQLDDDMFVHETCFERLLDGITSMSGDVAIAPALVFEPAGNNCYEMEHTDSRTTTMVHGINWFKPGKITRSGMNIGLNAFKATERYSDVEWVPGGCVIHKRKNLILFDFFPFKGKAFFEDVIQSIHLRRGVRLLVDKLAICGIDPYEPVPVTKWQAVKEFNKYFTYRKHVVKLEGNSIIFLLLDGFRTYLFTSIGNLNQGLRNLLKR